MGKKEKRDGPGPYHVVNQVTGKHIGPFTTEVDAALARSIGTAGWPGGRVLNFEDFAQHLAEG